MPWRTTASHARHSRGFSGSVLALGLLASTLAQAEITGSYDGTATARSGAQAIVAASLLETAGSVVGTIAADFGDGSGSAVFATSGRLRGVRLKLSGIDAASGSALSWRGRTLGEALDGRLKVKRPQGRFAARLRFARRVEQPPDEPPPHCDNAFFTGQVMGRTLAICAACHVAGGSAQATTFRVTPTDPLATQDSVALHIDMANPGASRILAKPTGQLPHGGGTRLLPGSEELQILQQWVELVATGRQCDGAPADAPMAPLQPHELAIRGAMDLRGRRPTLQELETIEADSGTWPTLVDAWLASPEFLERVKDLYDEALLVRREDFSDESRDETWAIYGEALELIAWIVANDRPFTEIGTADYTVANALFQRDRQRMPYPMEPVSGLDWQPSRYLDGRPHAGLLSTSAFYEVWDTNNTNLNRRRANRWSIVFHCYNFLDTPVDVTRNVDNNNAGAVLSAVTTRTDCKACHDRLDPMASFLFPTDNAFGLEDGDANAFWRGNPERWRTANKRPPAVYGMPGSDLRDYGRLLVTHPRFAECQTRRAFQLLFQRAPRTNRELELARDIAQRWVTEDGHRFRALVRRWMLSDAYTHQPADGDPAWIRRASPERLETLIEDLTGFVWTRPAQDDQDNSDPNSDPPRTEPVPLLTTEEDGYRIILGGINGTTVSGRSYALNAPVLAVQRKLAALAAAHVVTTDLSTADGARRLLDGVRGDEQPETDEAAIRAALTRIGRRLYGVRWSTDDPHVDVLHRLYTALYADRSQASVVPGTPGERAWRGVLVAMLRSPRLLLY